MKTNPIRRQRIERAGYALLTVAALAVVLPILLVIGAILARGMSAINWEFLTAMPRNGMKAGGIFPAIIGTLLLTWVRRRPRSLSAWPAPSTWPNMPATPG